MGLDNDVFHENLDIKIPRLWSNSKSALNMPIFIDKVQAKEKNCYLYPVRRHMRLRFYTFDNSWILYGDGVCVCVPTPRIERMTSSPMHMHV